MKRVLIIGKDSYIGDSFAQYVKEDSNFHIDIADSFDNRWKEADFSSYDTVFCVAGIAHISTKPSMEQLYYKVNRDLAIEIAAYAKEAGVGQFVFMSSMIIYGKDGKVGEKKVIVTGEEYAPENAYGKSKLEADLTIQAMGGEAYKPVIIRTPVVYGTNCKGNFPRLVKLAKRLPIVPTIHNERSMIYIDNLCEFIKQCILLEKAGVFYPQNSEYVDTIELIKSVRALSNKKTIETSILNPFIKLGSKFLGVINKAFGNKVYDWTLSRIFENEYDLVKFIDSLK